MAPALSKFKLVSLTTTIGFTVAGVLCIGYFVYEYLKSNQQEEEVEELTDKNNDVGNRFQKIMQSLDSEDDQMILNGLLSLGNLTAFREFQILVRENDGLTKITSLLKSTSIDIKIQAINVINNLAMDVENQKILRDLIPELASLLHDQSSSVNLCLAVTRVLTNLSTLDENHDLILPQSIYLYDLLKSPDQTLKVQILKILVNLSTNEKNVESLLEVDLQMINAIADFIDYSTNDDLLLRSLTCLSNILSTLHQKWNSGDKRLVSTAEFVPVGMREKLEELSLHSNEEIRSRSEKALLALNDSLPTETGRNVANVDLVEVLRL